MGVLNDLARAGKADSVRRQLQQGRSRDLLNTMGNNGFYPIHEAASSGHVDVIHELLDFDCDIDVRTGGFDEERTPLMLAAKKGHSTVVRCLLDAGAEINALDEEKHTALSLAAQHGREDAVQVLLEFGADMGSSGLHPARIAVYQGHAEILELFLQQGISPNRPDEEETSLIEDARRLKKEEIADLLLRYGADDGQAY